MVSRLRVLLEAVTTVLVGPVLQVPCSTYKTAALQPRICVRCSRRRAF